MAAIPPPPPPPQVAVHPAVQPLSSLLGTWRGQGEGTFPTIAPFKYSEEVQFSHSPNKTWELSSGEAMHSESGYWRPKLDGTIEVVIAQSTGLVEVQLFMFCYGENFKNTGSAFRFYALMLYFNLQKGTYDEQISVKLKSALVGNGSKVNEIHRVFELINGEELSYVVEMATILTSLQTHLKACLRKL
ncbi:hypothetical protein BUALT_Bualt18G0090500 [Buddleja alternifolia]|uniref:THAP4-like heme-binding domain-containing protein n=1 Tax=Buddleja alternifolia TaxID=168488 RepID=A0AAV6WEG0_9LAMI|nr:hypothetical protein BUALT_Bualt18G0090500 [Buddleja alternifolia]